jgi:hypothetical protein
VTRMGLILLACCPALAATDPCVTLGIPVWTNGQVQMTLNGEPGVSYVVESSHDLQTWAPVLTNSDAAPSRLISLDAPGDGSFYRMSRRALPRIGAGITTQSNINFLGNRIFQSCGEGIVRTPQNG